MTQALIYLTSSANTSYYRYNTGEIVVLSETLSQAHQPEQKCSQKIISHKNSHAHKLSGKVHYLLSTHLHLHSNKAPQNIDNPGCFL